MTEPDRNWFGRGLSNGMFPEVKRASARANCRVVYTTRRLSVKANLQESQHGPEKNENRDDL